MAQRDSDEDVVGAYLRQLGSLSRLTVEEESLYTRDFFEKREDLLQRLSHFPRLLRPRIAACRSSEVIELDDVNDREGRKKERTIALLSALDQLAEHLDGVNAEAKLLLYGSLKRLFRRYQFDAAFYQGCLDELTGCAVALDLEPGTSTLDPGAATALVQMEAAEFGDLLTELRTIYQELEATRILLVESNLRLVISVAKKYLNCGLPFPDLIQEGNMGLMQGVDRFEPHRGHRFSTYVVWWIRQGITSALSSLARTIRIPANLAASLHRIMRAEQKLLQELGHEPDVEEIAEEVGLEPARISALRKMNRQTISLQSTIDHESDRTLNEIFVDADSPSPADTVSDRLLRETIDEVLNTLTDRERTIIIHRFGLMGQTTMTLEELSGQFDVTHERIRQIEGIALKKLRHPSRRRYFDGYC